MFAMKTSSYALLGLAGLLTLVVALLAASYPTRTARRAKFVATIRAEFESSRAELEKFVELTDAKGQNTIGEADLAPIRETPLGRRILRVTRDSNGNLYFILRDSWVTFNVGVVWRKGSADLLGDGEEPRLNSVEKIGDHWFLYYAS